MELDKYLKALEECPDEMVFHGKDKRLLSRLTTELGIYDNWPILLSAKYDEVVKDLLASIVSNELFSGQYRLVEERINNKRGLFNNIFNYVPGTILMQVRNSICSLDYSADYPKLEHSSRQKKEFNMSFSLHPYQEKKIEGVENSRAMAIVLADIGRYVQKKGFALCFPCSMGWDNLEDLSRIVYYPSIHT